MSKIRILIADDHETVREGLKTIISVHPQMEVVGEAGDGHAAIESARSLQPDVIVMDISMPRLNGRKATEKLKEVCPNVRVLALTRHTDEAYVQELLRAGAAGYVLKQSAASELIHAITAIADGNSYLDPAVTKKVMGNYVGREIALRGERQNQAPSNREIEVLRQIAWGYSNKEIAAQLDISVKTIEAHKANVMRKLELRSRIDIVRFAILQGWLQDT